MANSFEFQLITQMIKGFGFEKSFASILSECHKDSLKPTYQCFNLDHKALPANSNMKAVNMLPVTPGLIANPTTIQLVIPATSTIGSQLLATPVSIVSVPPPVMQTPSLASSNSPSNEILSKESEKKHERLPFELRANIDNIISQHKNSTVEISAQDIYNILLKQQPELDYPKKKLLKAISRIKTKRKHQQTEL